MYIIVESVNHLLGFYPKVVMFFEELIQPVKSCNQHTC